MIIKRKIELQPPYLLLLVPIIYYDQTKANRQNFPKTTSGRQTEQSGVQTSVRKEKQKVKIRERKVQYSQAAGITIRPKAFREL